MSSDFTTSEINTLDNLGKAQGIDPGAGTTSPVINLNYYSIVNGQKYYMEYTNDLAGSNWMMSGQPVTPNGNGNYSNLKFDGYVDENGQKISQSEFLNGDLSFDINNLDNISNQNKINMIKKIAAMYFNFGGYQNSSNDVSVSKQLLEGQNGININNMTVNLNNTMTINGQTLYALEIQPNEPFYISLTGFIYVGQEHYLSKPFNVIGMTNEQVKQREKYM